MVRTRERPILSDTFSAIVFCFDFAAVNIGESQAASHEKKTKKAKDRKTEGKIGPSGPRSI